MLKRVCGVVLMGALTYAKNEAQGGPPVLRATPLLIFPPSRISSQGRRRLPAGAALDLRPWGSGRSATRSGCVAAEVTAEISEALQLGRREHRADPKLL